MPDTAPLSVIVTPQQLTEWRRAAGMTRAELATALCVSGATIRNLENGRAFRPITQLAVAAYFGKLRREPIPVAGAVDDDTLRWLRANDLGPPLDEIAGMA